MPAVIANASMSFVLTSDCRGRAKSGLLPIKMFESLACGTPVIATNQPEQAEFLAAADAGPLLESTTPQTICAAAQRLLQDPQAARAAAQRGRRLIETDYTWASTAKRLSDTLREQIATNSDNKIRWRRHPLYHGAMTHAHCAMVQHRLTCRPNRTCPPARRRSPSPGRRWRWCTHPVSGSLSIRRPRPTPASGRWVTPRCRRSH